MLHKIKVGQIWKSIILQYEVIAINIGTATVKSIFMNVLYEWETIETIGGICVELPENWTVSEPYKEQVIVGIPLDPTLPILEAGHLQDRMRRRKRA